MRVLQPVVVGTRAESAVGDTVRRRTLAWALIRAVGVAFLIPASVPRAAAADADPHGAAVANVQVCEAAGGTAGVEADQYGNGYQAITVTCNGGMLDGWKCFHDNYQEWNCNDDAPGYIPVLPSGETIDLSDLAPPVTRNQSSGNEDVRASSSPSSHDQDESHHKKGKGKKSKKGKKGGKHRRR